MKQRRAYQDTTVAANQSKAEIRELLVRYGAEQFGIIESGERAVIGFVAQGRMVRLEVPLPDRRQSATTAAGKFLRAGSAAALSVHDQEERRIWRATRAWIYAQLEAVESGIRTFEEAWFADTVLPNGETVSRWYGRQADELGRQGRLPVLLPGLEEKMLRGVEDA